MVEFVMIVCFYVEVLFCVVKVGSLVVWFDFVDEMVQVVVYFEVQVLVQNFFVLYDKLVEVFVVVLKILLLVEVINFVKILVDNGCLVLLLQIVE